MDEQTIKPSRWFYVLAVLVVVIGFAIFGLLLFKNLSGITDSLIQVVVPGKIDITFSEAGKYTIFHEYQSVVGNKVYKTEEISGLQCALTSQETGAEIALSSPSGSSTYTLGGRAGRSLWVFSIDKPGNYQISAWYPEAQEGQEVVLAIGSGFTGKIVGTVFSSLAILFGSIAIAVVITVVTAIKREKAIKLLKAQNT
jgi:hypothetical protein